MGFLQIEGLWRPCVEQVYQLHFPVTFAHFMFLCLIFVILTIFHTFSLLLFVVVCVINVL